MKKIALLGLFIATTALAIFTSATVKQIDTIKNNTATDITIDPTGDLILTSATANRVPYFDASKKLFSSSVTDTELGYLSGVTSAIQTQLDSKAADADVVKLTGDQSIAGVKTFTGQIVASTTSNGNRPCPTMTEAQRDAIASPVLGDCVTNSDTSSLNVYDGTAWGAVGGGGQGGINYIEQYNAESSITDWVTYADAAGENAVDGTGGTANITWTKNPTTPLVESNDFKLTKDAANRQGEGVAVPFTIDTGYQSNKIYIAFKYDASSANYADDDIRIQVYDITNSRLIRVNGEDLKGSTKGNYLGWFQSSADSTSYRLIFHISSTNASAYDVYFDNIQVGPREVSYGSANTDSKPYTPTFSASFGTTSSVDFTYSRNGEYLEIIGRFAFGTTTAAEAQIGLPDNLKVSSKITSVQQVGTWVHSATAEAFEGAILATAGDNFLNVGKQGAGTGGGSILNANSLGSSRAMLLFAKVPIEGWSSNSIQSEDIGNREIRVRGAGNGGTSITANVTDIDFTEVEDTSGAWNGTQFTAPETGDYEVSGAVITNASTSAVIDVYIGGVQSHRIGFNVSTQSHPFSGKVRLTKGQVMSLRMGATVTLLNDNLHKIHIQKLAQPQTLLETETVAARYTSDSGQSIPNNSITIVIFEDLVKDTHNAYNTSTGVYTIPVSGWYYIDGLVRYDSAAVAASVFLSTYIYINGTTVHTKDREFSTSDSVTYSIQSSLVTYLEKGDTIDFRVYQNTGVSEPLSTVSTNNIFSIIRIK